MTALVRWLKVAVALVLLGTGLAAWYVYLHFTDPETVRTMLLTWLAQNCPQAKVEIASADANLFRGVNLRGCTVRATADPLEDILSFDSINLVPDHDRLVQGKLHARRIALAHPTLKLHQDADGRWNFQNLLTGRPIRFPEPTDVNLKGARIVVTRDQPGMPTFTIDNVHGTVKLRPPGEATFEIHGTHPLVKDVHVSAKVDFVTQTLDIDAQSTEPLQLANIRAHLPHAALDRLQPVTYMDGKVRFEFHGSAQRTNEALEWDGRIEGDIQQLAVAHQQLPEILRDGQARFVATKEGLRLSDIHFAVGTARADLEVDWPGWSDDQLTVEGRVAGIELTSDIRDLLDDRGKESWDRLQPTGRADLVGRVIRYGDSTAVTGSALLHHVSFTFDKFPYPVRSVTGEAALATDGTLTYAFTGKAGDAPIEVNGRHEPGPLPTAASVTIRGKGVILDETLLAALPEPSSRVLRELRPGETVGDFECIVSRPAGSHRADYHIEADVQSEYANWVQFPYPIRQIKGHVSVEPGRVRLRDFVGQSGETTIAVEGNVWSQTEGAHTEIGIRAIRLPVSDQLLASLPDTSRQGIKSLNMTGTVDLLCNAVKETDKPLYIELEIDPARAAIEPDAFPYRLERFDGRVIYRDGLIEWEPMTAWHGPMPLRCSGSLSTAKTGGRLELRGLESTGLVYDAALRRASPPSLRKTLDFLNPTKPVGLQFPHVSVEWAQAGQRNWTIEMEGGITLNDANLIPDVGLKNVNGIVWYKGRCVNDQPDFEGNIRMSRVIVEGFEATNVRSSFKIDGSRVEFPNLRGEMYGGQVHGQVRAETGERSAYESRFNLYGANLQKFFQSRPEVQATASGMVYLDLFLEGDANDIGQLKGRGKLDVLDADIDRLPLLQDLFRIGNLQPPCGRAFEEVNCDFRVDNRIVWLETLDLLGPPNLIGPSFNLFSDGEGSLDVDTWELDLALSARWGRGRLRVPVLTPSFNLASDQVFSYNVRGQLNNPVITPAPLKGLFRMIDGDNPGEYARRRRFR